MPIDYRLAKLIITNFRGIKSLAIDLPEKATTHLIGGNNSGKSTVLNAMALALKGGGFHLFHPQPFDFFHDKTGTAESSFDIELHFDANTENELPAVQGVGKPEPVHGIRVEGRMDGTGLLKHRHVFFNASQGSITVSNRTPLSKADKETFKDHGLGFRKHYSKFEDIWGHLPEVWLLSPDNLYKSLYEWKTGPLQKLSKMLTQKFLSEEWELDWKGEKRPMPETIHRLHKFFQQSVTEFPFWKDDLRPKLEKTLTGYVGHQARIGLEPDIRTIEDWLAQQLQASFAADVGGPLTPLKFMGQGWQSLVRIAALDVISQYPDQIRDRVVLLFEEPETYLHPHLCRRLRTVLDKLSDQGWVVLTATHAPEFINFASTQCIVRLWRQGDDVVHGSIHSDDINDEAKFQERLDEHGNHEMLFGHRLVLCEGKDDQYAARMYLEKSDVDLDGRSVSILGVRGVSNLPEYARIAGCLGIPWFAITDEDLQDDGKVKPKTKDVREELEALKRECDRSDFWPGSLESCLSVPAGKKATPDWQRENTDPKPLETIKANHGDFSAVGETLKTWIENPVTIEPTSCS